MGEYVAETKVTLDQLNLIAPAFDLAWQRIVDGRVRPLPDGAVKERLAHIVVGLVMDATLTTIDAIALEAVRQVLDGHGQAPVS